MSADVWTEARLKRWLESRQRVRARTGVKVTQVVGRVVAYSTHPMVLIETDEGEKVWWRMDMCLPEDVS